MKWPAICLVLGVPALLNAAEIQGTVFDDPNYGGGAGRSYAVANASALASGFPAAPAGDHVGVGGARVELFDVATGLCVAATTSAADGTYSFALLPGGSFTVRVVNQGVPSVRAGWVGAIPVQTYRTSGDADANDIADPSVDRVGGEDPALLDAAAATDCTGTGSATTLASLTSPTATAQSLAPFTLGAATVMTGVDFGFNFSTVVATRDSGQGTLRQFVANATELGSRSLLDQAGCGADWNTMTVSKLPAARETSIFMVNNNLAASSTCAVTGYAAGGVRAGTNLFTSGRALLTMSSAITVSVADVRLDATTQTVNVGNDMPGDLGTGGTVGVGATTLARFQQPEVETTGTGVRIVLTGARTEVRGFALHNAGIHLNGDNALGQDNLVGMRSDGTTGTGFTAFYGIQLNSRSNMVARHNYVKVNNSGIRMEAGSTNALVEFNEVDRPSTGHSDTYDGILVIGAATSPVVQFNRVQNQRGGGLELGFSSAATVTNSVWQENTVMFNGFNTVPTVPSTEPVGFAVWNVSNTTTALVRRNVITDNAANGILVMDAHNIRISENVLARNGVIPGVNLSIELDPVARNPNGYGTPHGVSANNGSVNRGALIAAQPNDDVDYPVFTAIVVQTGILSLQGFVGREPNDTDFAFATVEIFQLADDGDNNGEIILGDGQSVPHGETIRYLGSLTADANGNLNGSMPVTGLSVGDLIGATATLCAVNPCATSTTAGSTSEVGSNRVSASTETGDAPEGGTVVAGVARNYASTIAVGGPVHGVFAGLRLGTLVDTDLDGAPGAAANGDDLAGVDDEDGVPSWTPLTTLSTGYSISTTVTNTLGSTATLSGWVDFNTNGIFEATEFTSVAVNNGTADGTAVLTWANIGGGGANPPATVAGTSYVRLRLTNTLLTDNVVTAVDERSRGLAADGEVEDYVLRINTVPVSLPDSLSIAEDTAGNVAVLANDTGLVDGVASLSISLAGLLGTATVNNNGTPANLADDTVDYAPNANANGLDSFEYTVCDVDGDCATGTVSVTIGATNDPPTISNVLDQSTNEDTATGAIVITVGDIDTAVASLTMSGTSSNTAVVPNANIVFGGSGSARTVTITPAANQNGPTTITLTVSDGALTATDTFVLTVNAANDPPTISNVLDQSTNEDTATGAIVITVGDIDTAVASLTMSGTSSNTAVVPNANIVFGGSGSARTVTITPAANQNGPTTITLTVSDGALTATDTFVLTVNAANDPPTISNVLDQSTNEDTATGAIVITVGDIDTAVASLTMSGTSSNTAVVPNANIVFGGSGSARTVTITPAANQNGPTTITLTVSDGALTATDTFVLTVNAANDPPTISNVLDQSTNEDTATGAIVITVGDIDTAVASLTMSGTSSNTAVVPNANIVFGGSGSARTVTITPAANQNGPTTITLTVSDGVLTATDTFVLTVNAANDPPTISNVLDQSTNEDTATGAIVITVGDIDTAVASLTMSGTSSNTAVVPNANIVFGGSGSARTVTITPAANQNGPTTITLTVSDGALTATDTFVLTVNAANDPPTISNVLDQSTNEDTTTGAIVITVGDIDTAVASLTMSGTSSNTAVVPNANIVFGGSGSARTVTITPAANQNGPTTITLTVSDGALTATDTFVLTVNAANDPPTISNVLDQSTNEDTATGAIVITVGDIDTAVASLTMSGTSSNTTLVPNANIVFGGSGSARTVTITPAPNQNGTATITLTVSDGALTATETFVLTVDPINDAPVITSLGGGANGVVDVPEGTTAVVDVTVLDGDSGSLTFSLVGGADEALFAVEPGTGALRFLVAPDRESPADADGNNVYVVRVRVSDGALTDEQDIEVTVTNVNEAPVITSLGGGANAAISIVENVTVVSVVTGTDVDSSGLVFALGGGADQALFTLNAATGQLTFNAPPNFELPTDADANNTYVVMVVIQDGEGGQDTQEITVTVTDVNEAPEIVSNGGGAVATVNVDEANAVVTTVAAVGPEPADVITYTIQGGVDAAFFALDPVTGALRFLVAPMFNSPQDQDLNNVYEVLVRADDGAQSDEQLVMAVVTNVNDPPVFVTGNAATVAEGTLAILTAAATDLDGDAVSFSITGGADSARVTITPSGELGFVTALDFEGPVDADANNTYVVEITATDFRGLSTVLTLTIQVTNVGCQTSATCGGTTPACDTAMDLCVACSLDTQCAPQHCAPTGACVECTSNAHCLSGLACLMTTFTCQVDADGDGLADDEELTLRTDPTDADTDDDGVMDGAEPDYAADTDADGLINALDDDSDNDGLFDGTELGITVPSAGTQVSRGSFVADMDPSSTTDPLDRDSDNGSVSDGSEDANRNGRVDAGETDPNNPSDDLDNGDTDGDGLSNALEASLGTDPADADTDDDGVLDGAEPNLASDTDGDTLINALDPDSDNDLVFDGTELGVTTPPAATNVGRGNFVADADPTTTTRPMLADTDRGGKTDGDEDSNHNGMVDTGETDPNNPLDDTGGSGSSSSVGGSSGNSGALSGSMGGASSADAPSSAGGSSASASAASAGESSTSSGPLASSGPGPDSSGLSGSAEASSSPGATSSSGDVSSGTSVLSSSAGVSLSGSSRASGSGSAGSSASGSVSVGGASSLGVVGPSSNAVTGLDEDADGDGFPDRGVTTGGCLGCRDADPSGIMACAALLWWTRQRRRSGHTAG